MSELSQSEIQKLVRQRFEQALEEDEAMRANRKPLSEEELMVEWDLNSSFLSETKEQLAKSDYHNVSKPVEWHLVDNGLDVNKQSEAQLVRMNVKKSLSERTINKHLTRIGTLFDYAITQTDEKACQRFPVSDDAKIMRMFGKPTHFGRTNAADMRHRGLVQFENLCEVGGSHVGKFHCRSVP